MNEKSRILLLSFYFSFLTACSNTLKSPGGQSTVYLVDHGYHSSLVVSINEGSKYLEYAFGEWRWFALEQSQWWRLPATLFWPTTATLARGEHQVMPYFAGDHLYSFEVSKGRVEALVNQLEKRFFKNSSVNKPYYNQRYSLYFVPLDESYHLFNNCNHRIAEWLDQLGVEVGGMRMLSNWRIRE